MIERQAVMDCIQSMRNQLHELASGAIKLSGSYPLEQEAAWHNVQAADIMLGLLKTTPSFKEALATHEDKTVVNAMLRYCLPSIVGYAKLNHLLRSIEHRNSILGLPPEKYASGLSDVEARKITIDLWMALDLLRKDTSENHKQEPFPGSPSEGGGERHL